MGLSLADFDPTSAGSAFGGIVRSGINAVGGGGVLASVDQAAARRRASGSVSSPPPAPSVLPGIPRWALYAGAAAAAGLVLFLVLRKR